jgi:hypothetical protein
VERTDETTAGLKARENRIQGRPLIISANKLHEGLER